MVKEPSNMEKSFICVGTCSISQPSRDGSELNFTLGLRIGDMGHGIYLMEREEFRSGSWKATREGRWKIAYEM